MDNIYAKKKDLFNVEQETISLEALRSLQLRKLRAAIQYAAAKSPLYKKKLSPKDARMDSLDDIARLFLSTLGSYSQALRPKNRVLKQLADRNVGAHVGT